MQLSTRPRLLAALAAGTVLLAPLAGCGGSGAKNAGAHSTSSSTPTNSSDPSATPQDPGTGTQAQGTTIDPNTFIRTVVDKMRQKRTAHMLIEMGSSMTADAEVSYGTRTAMRMTLTTGGQTMKALLVGGAVYVQTPPNKKYIKIDKSTPGAGSILSSFSDLSPTQSVSALKGAIKKVVKLGSTTIDGTRLTHYALTVDTAAVVKQFGQAIAGTDLPKLVTYAMYLDGDNLLRRIDMDVAGQKVTMKVDHWGTPYDFTAPPASQILKQ